MTESIKTKQIRCLSIILFHWAYLCTVIHTSVSDNESKSSAGQTRIRELLSRYCVQHKDFLVPVYTTRK